MEWILLLERFIGNVLIKLMSKTSAAAACLRQVKLILGLKWRQICDEMSSQNCDDSAPNRHSQFTMTKKIAFGAELLQSAQRRL